MPSPVNPADAAAVVPAPSADICSKIKLVFLQFPRLFLDLITYMFDSAGNATEEFKDDLSHISPGFMSPYAADSVPTGWLLCNGQAVNRINYAALFSVIGTTFGVGDGSTTFNVPDARGKFIMGVSASHVLGDSGGAETHTLTIAQMPAHNHPIASSTGQTGTGAADSKPNSAGPQVSGNTGGGQAHSILNPFLAVHYLIKT